MKEKDLVKTYINFFRTLAFHFSGCLLRFLALSGVVSTGEEKESIAKKFKN